MRLTQAPQRFGARFLNSYGLQTGNALDLDIEAEELGADRGAGGGGVAEVADVDLVHLLEILGGELGEIDAGADDILEIGAGRSEDLLHIFENQLGLACDGAALDFAGGGVPRRLAGDKDEFSLGNNAERVGTEGGRAARDITKFGFHPAHLNGSTAARQAGSCRRVNLWEDKHDWLVKRGTALLRSYHHWTGRHLVDPTGQAERDARAIFDAPFVVVSGGAEEDQLLNYANLTALQLWEMDWETLVKTPSRHTAEPMHRDERAEFLRRVRENGFIDDYSGIRISRTGRRFRIRQATVWNVLDESGVYAGQAATFSSWEFLPSDKS